METLLQEPFPSTVLLSTSTVTTFVLGTEETLRGTDEASVLSPVLACVGAVETLPPRVTSVIRVALSVVCVAAVFVGVLTVALEVGWLEGL